MNLDFTSYNSQPEYTDKEPQHASEIENRRNSDTACRCKRSEIVCTDVTSVCLTPKDKQTSPSLTTIHQEVFPGTTDPDQCFSRQQFY